MLTMSTGRAPFRHINDEAVVFDGLDDAIIGTGGQHNSLQLVIYSARLIIEVLMNQSEMSHEEAIEHFNFNIASLNAGPGTPIIMWEA